MYNFAHIELTEILILRTIVILLITLTHEKGNQITNLSCSRATLSVGFDVAGVRAHDTERAEDF